MSTKTSKQRIYASLLMLGALILLFRTILMVTQGNLEILVFWASVLLIAEMLLDAGCFFSSLKWWVANDKNYASIPLKFGAAAAILHAFRVLVFVVGRVGPWIDFDVNLQHRALHAARWNMGQIYFASIMSVLGIIGVIIIWMVRRRARKRPLPQDQILP